MTAVLRRGVWIVVVVAVLFGNLGAVYVIRADGKGVTSQAQLVVTGRAATTSQDNAYTASQYVNQRMSTYAEVATSEVVLQPAANALGVDEVDLASAVTATVPLQTTVLAIAVTGTNPQRAQQRAQAVLTSLSDQIIKLETQSGDPTRVDVRILSAASLPARSSLPAVPLAGIAGLLLGLLLALAGLAATHLLRPRGTGSASAPSEPAPVEPAIAQGVAATAATSTPQVSSPAGPSARTSPQAMEKPAATTARAQKESARAEGKAARDAFLPGGTSATDTAAAAPSSRVVDAGAEVPSRPGRDVDRASHSRSNTVGGAIPPGR